MCAVTTARTIIRQTLNKYMQPCRYSLKRISSGIYSLWLAAPRINDGWIVDLQSLWISVELNPDAAPWNS